MALFGRPTIPTPLLLALQVSFNYLRMEELHRHQDESLELEVAATVREALRLPAIQPDSQTCDIAVKQLFYREISEISTCRDINLRAHHGLRSPKGLSCGTCRYCWDSRSRAAHEALRKFRTPCTWRKLYLTACV